MNRPRLPLLRRTSSSDAPRHNAIWLQYKDVIVLLLGALIGILTSFLTASQQAQFQRDQAISEKRFAVLRELVELNNESWRRLDVHIETITQTLAKSSEVLAGTDEEKFLEAIPDLSKGIDPLIQDFKSEQKTYEAKMDGLLTLLSYISEEKLPITRLDLDFQKFESRGTALSAKLEESLKKDRSSKGVKLAFTTFLADVETLFGEVREYLKSERIRVNGELRGVAHALLKP